MSTYVPSPHSDKTRTLTKKLATQNAKKAVGDVISNTFQSGMQELARTASTLISHPRINTKHRISSQLDTYEDSINTRRLPPSTSVS